MATREKRKAVARASSTAKKARVSELSRSPSNEEKEEHLKWTKISDECDVLYKAAFFENTKGHFNFLKAGPLVEQHNHSRLARP